MEHWGVRHGRRGWEQGWKDCSCLGVAGQGGVSINAAQGLPEILFLEGRLYLLD